MERLIVTLDGPAGSGKSTVARLLARRLGVKFLDTGAMYRGLTARVLARGIDPATESPAVVELARHSELTFDWSRDPPRLRVSGRDVTDRLRDPDVTGAVSEVASLRAVRQVLVGIQQRLGREHPRLVAEGRDQGSVVFPDADAKFYLEASPAVRARRRAEQLRAGGQPVNQERIRQTILDRDQRDEQREDGPLIRPSDAESLDTSGLTLDEVVDRLEQSVRKGCGAAD